MTDADRQRLYRERKRLGLRCVTVTVSDEAVGALQNAGLLDYEDLSDVLAEIIEESAYEFARGGRNA